MSSRRRSRRSGSPARTASSREDYGESLEVQGYPKAELLLRAREFLHSALTHLEEKRFHRIFPDLGAALELLGKAVLSKLSPALIVPNDFDSLVSVLRLPVAASRRSVRVKTIDTKDLLDRIVRVLPPLEVERENLREIFELRNGTLHYVETPHDHFAHLIASMSRYIHKCAEFLNIRFDQLVTQEEHRQLLTHFNARDKSVWSALAAKRIAEAKAALREPQTPLHNEAPELPEAPALSGSSLPDTVMVHRKCPACQTTVGVPYYKQFADVLKEDYEGDTFRVVYVIKTFQCNWCRLEFPDPKYCVGAGIPMLLSGPAYQNLSEFEANPYAGWEYADEEQYGAGPGDGDEPYSEDDENTTAFGDSDEPVWEDD